MEELCKELVELPNDQFNFRPAWLFLRNIRHVFLPEFDEYVNKILLKL